MFQTMQLTAQYPATIVKVGDTHGTITKRGAIGKCLDDRKV